MRTSSNTVLSCISHLTGISRSRSAGRCAFSRTMTTSSAKVPVNFIRGWPAPSLLPAGKLKAASATVLSDPKLFVPGLEYGPDPGYQPLREELACFLGDFFGVAPDPRRICITGGASQNVACLLQSFTDPAYTQAVWVVAPCYHLICPILEDSGFRNRLRSIPEDEEGMRVDLLEEGLKEFENAKPGDPVSVAVRQSHLSLHPLTALMRMALT